MKHAKKIFLPLLAALAVLTNGCGSQFDPCNYVKALLDNSYKNDSTAFVEQEVGTKEQAEELYEEGIQNEINSLLSGAAISDGLKEEFSSVIKDIFKSVKYTVGESTKGENGSYEVAVTYQKMNIFLPAMESYMADLTAYTEEMNQKAENGEEVPSQDEITEQAYTYLKDALKNALGNVTYEEETSITMHVELSGNMYSVNENDLKDMELALFDLEALDDYLEQ